MAEVTDDRDLMTDEEEEERRRRLEALAAPTRLAPVGAPTVPTARTVAAEAPAVERLQPVGGDATSSLGGEQRLKPLSYAERQRLSTVSPGAPAGSAASDRSQIEKIEDQRANPWGSPENHPGFGGRLAHVLAKAGNIAGDIVAPVTMANVPGTEMHRDLEEQRLKGEEGRAETRESEIASRTASAGLAGRKEQSEEEERAARTENLKQKDSETLAARGLMRDADGNIKEDPTSPVAKRNQLALQSVQHVNDLRDAQKELAEARTEVEKAKNDPDSPAFKAAQQRLAMAAEAHRVASLNLGLHQEEFQNKLHEQELQKPSGQAQSRGAAAQSVLDIIPDLKTLVNKHRADMGPLMGRIARGEIAIGNVPPEIARVYAAMKSFYALQPAVHGFRNAEFVKDFESALGTLERNPDAFIAGMEGLKPTLDAVAKEGKTFHKRIVEGEGETPQRPKGVPDEAVWNKESRQWRLPNK
jgi:hypothetical protein